MPNLLSPGVAIVEKDFTSIVPNVATGVGAIAGRFTRGPVNTPVLLSTEDDLVRIFGNPTETNYLEWFTAAQFLQYTDQLWAVRAKPTGATNSYAETGTITGSVSFANQTEFDVNAGTIDTDAKFISRTLGSWGSNVAVIMVDSGTWSNFVLWDTHMMADGEYTSSLAGAFNGAPGTSNYVQTYAGASKNDEVHILILDATGFITGTQWQILEAYPHLSKAVDAVDYKGTSIYFPTVINVQSNYVWFGATTGLTSANGTTTFDVGTQTSAIGTGTFAPFNFTFSNPVQNTVSTSSTGMAGFGAVLHTGVDGTVGDESAVLTSYQLFANTELYNVNLFPAAGYNTVTLLQGLLENVAYPRRDSIVFYSPVKAAGANTVIFDSSATAVTDMIAWKNSLNIPEMYASYAVCDTGYKYIFDKYNNKYRWVPLNGDIAGLCAQTDRLADAWWSPGGFNRGGIKNVIKLAFNPTQAQRDVLYPQSINPVVIFPGQGPVLFGDKTMTLKPSAFDRINVRRLFIVLEKSISIAAKYQLFEFNDTFTRAQFKNMVEPFLRNIQGRRGITDFLVVCDSSNNPGSVIDANQFVASIYVKPARSINFITLNFVATRTDVQFSTVIGG